MTQTLHTTKSIVGRGVADGARLFRDWFDDLTEVAKRGEKAAYVFVGGNMVEILRAFDIPATLPEINALQTAFRHVSRDYLSIAEDYGFSPDICGYVKIDVGLKLKDGVHPMGLIPKPLLVVLNNYCNTFIKWGELWERFYEAPVVVLDYPMTRAKTPSPQGSDDFAYERDYLRGQIVEMIETCEGISGKKFDIDKFRQILQWSNEMNLSWKKVREVNRNRPAVFNSLTDGTVYLGMMNSYRGTEVGSRYFQDLVEELDYKVANGIGLEQRGPNGPVPVKEEFRLALNGTPCYPIFREFNEMFLKWGGVFVTSAYLDFASPGSLTGYQYDLEGDPLTSYAEGQLIMHNAGTDSMFHASTQMEWLAKDFAVDGLVFHPVKSCRTCSTGMADMRRAVAENLGMSTLFIESDLVDPQVVSIAQMRNRIDAFFEGMIARRQRKDDAA